jgi:amidase
LGSSVALVALVSCATVASKAPTYNVEEKSIADLEADLAAGKVNSAGLVQAYLARIETIDQRGPGLKAVLAVNPDVAAEALALDAERSAGKVRGPLHGVPILIKDNIETSAPLPTTAGSLALKDNVTRRDAPVIARLRAAGVIILGKTNLSEWANIRSSNSTSGWSAVGGFTRNPYALDRNPCGSSSGSGAAAAASLAAAAVGTETDGSVTCPSAVNGLVGIKPTVGLVSRSRIVPISVSQDTAGPMARSVADAAALLTAMAGSDPTDPATAEADARKQDYTKALDAGALKGARIGAARFLTGYNAGTDERFEAALAALRAAGAEVVDLPKGADDKTIGDAELTVLLTELKTGLNAYLADAAPGVSVRTLKDMIAFDKASADAELQWFGQDLFEKAEATGGLADPAYRKALATSQQLARKALDGFFNQQRLDAVVAPTTGPAWVSDALNGDHGGGSATTLPAVAGYPHITVPMGEVHGLPVGLSFIGPKWSEARLIGLGYAYEQATRLRRPPTYAERSPAGL